MNSKIDFLRKVASSIRELEKFGPSITELGDRILDDRMEMFEGTFNLKLPADFKMFMKRHNGFSIMGNTVYPIINSKFGQNLALVYEREHTLVKVPQFEYLIPFSDDGGGNFYCFDTRIHTKSGYSFPVIFWVSNFVYTVDNQPEIVYDSFLEFVQEVIIDWTLEDFDYDGNEK